MVWLKNVPRPLKPLVGKSPHHINSTHDFVKQVKQFTLAPVACLSSYDVSVLFTSVPVDPTLGVIKDPLEKNPTLMDRAEFCLKNMYFSFQDQFYEQIKGTALVPWSVPL